MKKIIGYARLSTKEQSNGITLEQQIDRLRNANVDEVLYDLESGRSDKRVNFQKIIALARKGLISKVICTRVDRFSRKVSTCIPIITELYEKYEVEFEFLDTPQLSLKDSGGKFALNVLAAAAQLESDMISQRVRAGIDYRKRMHLPNTNAPYGFVVINKERYELNQKPFLSTLPKYGQALGCTYSKADIAREFIDEFIKTKSSRKTVENIHIKLGIPKRYFGEGIQCGSRIFSKHEAQLTMVHEMGMNNWLRNPVLRGHTAYSTTLKKNIRYAHTDAWDVIEDTHPNHKLITSDEWILIDSIISTKAINRCGKYPETRRYFSGLVYCGHCGNKLTTRISSGKNNFEYYFCRSINCNSKAIRHDILNKQVIIEIFEKALNFEYENNSVEFITYNTESIIRIKNRLDRTIRAIQEDPLDPLLLKNKEDYERLLAEELNSNQGGEVWDKNAEEILNHPSLKDIGFLYTLGSYYKRIIYNKILKKIIICNGEITQVIFKV